MQFNEQQVISLLIAIPAFVAALTVHEFAHAWTAHRLGDPTAERQGRLTLDPLKHLDPLGSLFFVLSALVGFFFGWAKPVPFDPRFFSHPRRDAMLVAIAGPISNLLQVPIWLALVAVTARLMPEAAFEGGLNPWLLMYSLFEMGVYINLTLAAFNMIPLPPLDGHYVLQFFGGDPVARAFDAVRPYSFILLIVLLNLPAPFNIVSQVLRPVHGFSNSLIALALPANFVSSGF